MKTSSCKQYLTALLVWLAIGFASAQTPDTVKVQRKLLLRDKPRFSTNLQIEARWHGGFVMAHRPVMVYLQRRHVQGFELSFSKPINGSQLWHPFYRDAIVGFAFQHMNLGYNEVLGSGNGAYAFIRFNWLGHKNTRFRWSMGTGIAYASKTFDKVENHKNVAIGSHINALINMQLLLEQRITKNIFFNGGISFTHYSNGAFKTPNLGLNMPSLTAGLTYRIRPEPLTYTCTRQECERGHKPILFVIASISGKEVYPPDGKKYPVFTFMANALLPLGIKSGLIFTIDVFNDRSIPAIMKRDDPSLKIPYAKTIRPGFAIGHDLWLGRLSFVFQAGVYMYTYYKGDGLIYSRLGWRYQVNKWLLVNMSLKTHFAKADNVEIGIGYTIWGGPRVLRLL